MEKIKSLLHSHSSDKDRETTGNVTHDTKGTTGTAPQSSTGTAGTTAANESTPIYNEMTGHGGNASSTAGEASRFSNNPTAGAGTTTGLGEERHAGHAGTDGPIGGARVAGTSGDDSQLDSSRPHVSSGAYNGNSEASIKSGVIGFSPGSSGQGHAALPSNNAAEDRLDRNQIVGQGNAGTNTGSGLRNETIQEQSSTLPVSSGIGHSSSSTQQPLDPSRTADTDRSFPLSGGVTSGHHDHSSNTPSHGLHSLNTNERELGTKDGELSGRDHHGREGLAGAAAAAAGTAAASHGHHSRSPDSPVGTFSDRVGSPTGHSHMTSSVPEHNIHPDALHAAGARPLNESNEPGHGPPHETPHINTGTLLDYEDAFGSDPHTQHTGLLSYRPQTQRTGTSPRIPGEFPGATPPTERSNPILGEAGSTSTGPSTSHDLRHTGSLNDPSRSNESSSGHHLGRDAAIVGGVGAAGLGAATHHKHENPTSGSGNLYDDKNPYSSKSLDPRVVGGESRPNEQRFDPSTTSSTSRSQPLSGSSATIPPREEDRHHYGRDAAIGGGALGAGALAGSALSSNRHHEPTTQQSSPLPTTQHTSGTANPTSFGTAGAPAPRYETTTSTSHQSPSTSTGSYAESQPQHHYGRDAGLAGAGAATAGGLAYVGSRDQPGGQHTVGSTSEDPASKTIGPHSSNIANILDPRVQPDPTKQKDHITTGPHQSDSLNRADPKVEDKAGQHHYGRDAAVAGGAGAAGYGAYEAAKAYGDHRSTQPGASMQEQRYDPTAAGARASNPVPASSEYNYHNPDVAALASATGAGAPGHHGSTHGQTQQPYTTAQMAQQAQGYKEPEITGSDLGPKDHSSRNTALGAGAGLAGTAAAGYGLSHHGDNTTHAPSSSVQPGSSSLPQSTGTLAQGQQYPQNTDPTHSHDKRDAALLGGAGAAAGAGAGYAYGQRTQPQFDPKEQEKLDKETAKHQHDLEKKHDKQVHKLEKEHEKDLKKHEKEAAHHDDGEKKGGLLGFLHRDKSKKEPNPESADRRSDDHHYGRDAAVAGGVGAGAAGLAEHERDDQFGHGSGYKGKNLLHKEPPVGHPAREALEREHANDRIGTDGPFGSETTSRTDDHHYGRDAAIGGGALGAGALGAHELSNRDRTEPGTLSSTTSGVPGQHASGLSGQTSTLPDRTSEHHHGRDAAIGGGALGAGALGAHELSNRDRTEPGNLSSTTSGVPGAHENIVPGHHASGLAGQTSTLPDRTSEHHYGRDAAIGGGALGAGGLAAHELHDRRTDPTSTTVGHTGTGLAGSQQATIPGGTTSGSVIGNREEHAPFTGGKREHIGVDGPIGNPNMISGDRQTQKGVYGAHPVEDLAKDRTVIEPRTGLPMNVGRYGDGAGGTDGGPIGHHHHESVPGQVQPGTADTQHATTNWEDVAKKNTIY